MRAILLLILTHLSSFANSASSDPSPFPSPIILKNWFLTPTSVYPPYPSNLTYPLCLSFCLSTPSCTFINHNDLTSECYVYTHQLQVMKHQLVKGWTVEIPNTSVLHEGRVNGVLDSTSHITSKVLLPSLPLTSSYKFHVNNVPYNHTNTTTSPTGDPLPLDSPLNPYDRRYEGHKYKSRRRWSEQAYDAREYAGRDIYAGRGTEWILQFNIFYNPSLMCVGEKEGAGGKKSPKEQPIEIVTVAGLKVILRPSPNPPECRHIFFTSSKIQSEGGKKTVEGWLSKNELNEGWNKVWVAVKEDDSHPGKGGKSLVVGNLNGVTSGAVHYTQVDEDYLILNGGRGYELGGVVWHQGVNYGMHDNYGGPEGHMLSGVELKDENLKQQKIEESRIVRSDIVRQPFPSDLGRLTWDERMSKEKEWKSVCTGNTARDIERFMNDLDGLKLMECMGDSGGEKAMIKSNLLYSLDYTSNSIPYYVLHNPETPPPVKYMTSNSGLCTASLTALKDPTQLALRGYLTGTSRPLPILTLDTLTSTEEQHTYFQAASNAAPSTALRLAQSYYWGAPGIPQDHQQAFNLFQEAGEVPGNQQGEALYNLGVMYANGQAPRDVVQPDVRAIEVWERGAELGDVSSTTGLAGIYLGGRRLSNGTVIERNPMRAKEMYEKAAGMGSKDAMETIGKGFLHAWWDGGRNTTEAYKWYAKCAAYMKEACVANVGVGVGLRDGWISEWDREVDTEAVLDGIVSHEGRRMYEIDGIEIPASHDCYTGRKYMLQVASTASYVHDAIDKGLQAYEQGNLEKAHAEFVKCGLMGVQMCSERAFDVAVEMLDLADPTSKEAAKLRKLNKYMRVMLANDDHAWSITWLAHCYWGGYGGGGRGNKKGGRQDCEVNRTLALKLYEEGGMLGDDEATFNSAYINYFGGVPEVEVNRTKAKSELLVITGAGKMTEGYLAASLMLYGIEWLETLEEYWNYWVALVVGGESKKEGGNEGGGGGGEL